MEPLHQRQALELFQLVRTGVELYRDNPLPTLWIAHAEEHSSLCYERMPGAVAVESAAARYRVLKCRLRSSCCGLLELQMRPSYSTDTDLIEEGDLEQWLHSSAQDRDDGLIFHSTIQYFHPTEGEYLYHEKTWADLLALTATTSFDTYRSLSHPSLLVIQIACTSRMPISRERLSDCLRLWLTL
jgi:hypothetical protein